MDAAASTRHITVEAKIIRADGTVEDLGIISECKELLYKPAEESIDTLLEEDELKDLL